MSYARRSIAVAGLSAVVLAGCTAGDDDESVATDPVMEDVADAPADAEPRVTADFTSDESEAFAGDEAGALEDVAAPSAVEAVEPGVDLAVVSPAAGRDVVYLAAVELAVPDVLAATTQAAAIVESRGGFVASQYAQGGPAATSTVTFRVTPDAFAATLEALAELGDVRSRTIDSEDVSGQVVDLESRIVTAEASVERLRTFLAEASDADRVTDLERQLLERETTLEQLRGQLRGLEDRVNYSTVTVTFSEAPIAEPYAAVSVDTDAYLGHDDGSGCGSSGRLVVDSGEDVTVCYVVTNTGEVDLLDVAVRDAELGVDGDDVELVAGASDRLTPGARAVFIVETDASNDLSVARGDVSAVPVDGDDEPLTVIIGRDLSGVDITVEGTEVPSAGDGFDAGLSVLSAVIAAVVFGLALLVPLIPLVALVVGAVWLWRRRDRRDGDNARPEVGPATS